MNHETLGRFRRRLEARRDELLELIASAKKESAPVAPDNAIGRLTRVDAMQSQQMTSALTQRNREELARVERALTRLESGDYGTCLRCGEEIAEARLQAVPDAILCRECAGQTTAR